MPFQEDCHRCVTARQQGFAPACFEHFGDPVDPFQITPEMASNDRYDNTIADMEFGRVALESDVLDRQVEELYPPVDEGGHPVAVVPSANTPEPSYPQPAYPSAH